MVMFVVKAAAVGQVVEAEDATAVRGRKWERMMVDERMRMRR